MCTWVKGLVRKKHSKKGKENREKNGCKVILQQKTDRMGKQANKRVDLKRKKRERKEKERVEWW